MAEIVQILFLKDGMVALGFRQNVHVLNNLWDFLAAGWKKTKSHTKLHFERPLKK